MSSAISSVVLDKIPSNWLSRKLLNLTLLLGCGALPTIPAEFSQWTRYNSHANSSWLQIFSVRDFLIFVIFCLIWQYVFLISYSTECTEKGIFIRPDSKLDLFCLKKRRWTSPSWVTLTNGTYRKLTNTLKRKCK